MLCMHVGMVMDHFKKHDKKKPYTLYTLFYIVQWYMLSIKWIRVAQVIRCSHVHHNYIELNWRVMPAIL